MLKIKPSQITLPAILVLGFALRFVAVNFGLPHLYHADEPIVVNHALAYGAGDFNPHFFKIPPLISYLLFAAYGVFYLIGNLTGVFSGIEAFEIQFYADPSSYYLIARIIFGVIIGTATIGVLYRFADKYFDRTVAYVSALFLAVSFLHVRDSHYIYTDISLVLVLVCAFHVFGGMMDKRHSLKEHFGMGLMIGLATAIKYNGILIAVPYLLLSLCCRKDNRFILKEWTFAMVGAVMIFILLNPFSVLSFSEFLHQIRQEADAHSGVMWYHHLFYSLSEGIGIPLLVMSLLGIVSSLGRFDVMKAAIALFCLVYYMVICLWGQGYDRYVLPIVPFMCLMAASFVSLCRREHDRGRTVLMMALILCAVTPNIIKGFVFNGIMLQDDTRTLAKKWVEEHIPSGSTLGLEGIFFMPRLMHSREQLLEKKARISDTASVSSAQKRRIDYAIKKVSEGVSAYHLYYLSDSIDDENEFLFAGPKIPYDYEALKDLGIEYVITTRRNQKERNSEFKKLLEESAELVWTVTPYRSKDILWPIDIYPLTGGPFMMSDLLRRYRNGYQIKVYKL